MILKKQLCSKNCGDFRCYYAMDYHPKNDPKFDDLSRTLLGFKEGKPAAMLGMRRLLEEVLGEDFGIVVIPSHKPGTGKSSLQELAGVLSKQLTNVEDLSGCLVRHKLINKLSMGGNRDAQIHLDSIRVQNPNSLRNHDILLLDDILTSGNSMKASRQLLLAAKPRKIVCLALARTVRTA
jgi:predicted amidophosphoribosyltransferase